jgi:hypothetical protein
MRVLNGKTHCVADCAGAGETFRSTQQAALTEHGLHTPPAERKSAAERKPRDEVVIFKAPVVQAPYNPSDEQMD